MCSLFRHISQVELIRLDPQSSTGVGGGVTAAGGVVSATDMVVATIVAAARGLWAVSDAQEGRAELLKLGLLQTLPGLLQYNSAALQQAVIGILHRCLVEVSNMLLTRYFFAFLYTILSFFPNITFKLLLFCSANITIRLNIYVL